MKAIIRKILAAFAFALFSLNVLAQPTPPGGGGCTNCPPLTNYFAPHPYVPGLKLLTAGLSGTNLPINLLEADPAGTYDVFAASNLVGAAWNDVLQGTNGQTNFMLPTPFTGMGFFRAARTDPSVGDAGGMAFYFLSDPVNTNIVQALVIQGGPAAATAVLVDSTNFNGASWIPFTAIPLVNIGTNGGTHEVWFGFKGTNGIAYWTMDTITIDTTPPTIVITNPIASTTAKPIIQVQGYSTKPLAGIYFDVSNAAGVLTNQQGFVTSQFLDTNSFATTTNWFQCFDVPLTNGLNTVIVHATDVAGNVTTTNVSITLDFSGKTNPPVVQITWPQNGAQISGTNFTMDGQVDDETATVSASITDTNGDTNVVSGLVERDGKFWVEEIPLNPGTNVVTLTATDAAGNATSTNVSVIQAAITLTMDDVTPDSQLWQKTVNLTGKISDATYAVWVNGVKGTNYGNGTWSANNVPTTAGGTASFSMTGYAPNEQQPDGSYGN